MPRLIRQSRLEAGYMASNTIAPALFAPDPDVFHNALLDRGFISWGVYADGYRRAAELLVKQARTYHDRNILVFPVIFLYRQYLELSLKDFIIQGNRVVELRNALPMHHRLKALWDTCCRIAREPHSSSPSWSHCRARASVDPALENALGNICVRAVTRRDSCADSDDDMPARYELHHL